MTPADSSEALESLQRRLQFVESTRYRVDSFLSRLGLRRHPLLRDIPLFGASIAFDLFESLRNLRGLQHVGRARLEGFSGSMRLPQMPHYRGYWYDPARHALVGMHLGLDLNYHQGKYYVIETNLGAAIKPQRRAMYDTPLDPFISATLEIARTHGFKRIVFYAKHWPAHYIEEFELATRETGIECLGGSSAVRDPNPTYSMPGLPDRLQENTLYMMFPNLRTPISHFIHNKERSAAWLRETIDACPEKPQALAYIPTFHELVIPSEPEDPRWPNLVIKLANKDRGRFVLMGRFRSVEEARTALRMDAPDDVPGIFSIGMFERMKHRVFPRLQPIFQQFIPPQIVDGRACKTRLHLFISPLASEFLSAHTTTAGIRLPNRPEPGKVDATGAYNVSYSVDGAYRKLPPEEEATLRRAAREFGQMAQIAITKKFETGPADD